MSHQPGHFLLLVQLTNMPPPSYYDAMCKTVQGWEIVGGQALLAVLKNATPKTDAAARADAQAIANSICTIDDDDGSVWEIHSAHVELVKEYETFLPDAASVAAARAPTRNQPSSQQQDADYSRVKSPAEMARIREDRRHQRAADDAAIRTSRVNQALEDIQACLEQDYTFDSHIDDNEVRQIVTAQLKAAGYTVTPIQSRDGTKVIGINVHDVDNCYR